MGPGEIWIDDAVLLLLLSCIILFEMLWDFVTEGALVLPMEGSNRFVTIQRVPIACVPNDNFDDSSVAPGSVPMPSVFSPAVEDAPDFPPSYPCDNTRRALANTARDSSFPLYRRTSRW